MRAELSTHLSVPVCVGVIFCAYRSLCCSVPATDCQLLRILRETDSP